MKRLNSFVLCLAAAVAFAAVTLPMTGCDLLNDEQTENPDDDNDPVVGGGSKDRTIYRCVSRIKAVGTNGEGERFETEYAFWYDDEGHIAEFSFTGNEASGLTTGVMKFIRNGNEVRLESEGGDESVADKTVATITLNDDGYATEYIWYSYYQESAPEIMQSDGTVVESSEEEIVKVAHRQILTYDNEYLVKVEAVSESAGTPMIFTWESGNLVSISGMNLRDEETGIAKSGTVEFAYGATRYIPITIKMAENPINFVGEISLFSEFLGQPSRYLPESISVDGVLIPVTYTLDPDEDIVTTMNYNGTTIEFFY